MPSTTQQRIDRAFARVAARTTDYIQPVSVYCKERAQNGQISLRLCATGFGYKASSDATFETGSFQQQTDLPQAIYFVKDLEVAPVEDNILVVNNRQRYNIDNVDRYGDVTNAFTLNVTLRGSEQ